MVTCLLVWGHKLFPLLPCLHAHSLTGTTGYTPCAMRLAQDSHPVRRTALDCIKQPYTHLFSHIPRLIFLQSPVSEQVIHARSLNTIQQVPVMQHLIMTVWEAQEQRWPFRLLPILQMAMRAQVKHRVKTDV